MTGASYLPFQSDSFHLSSKNGSEDRWWCLTSWNEGELLLESFRAFSVFCCYLKFCTWFSSLLHRINRLADAVGRSCPDRYWVTLFRDLFCLQWWILRTQAPFTRTYGTLWNVVTTFVRTSMTNISVNTRRKCWIETHWTRRVWAENLTGLLAESNCRALMGTLG